ncbi:MAG: hypothetical protein ACYC3O_05540 [Burkholderiales bacterium]
MNTQSRYTLLGICLVSAFGNAALAATVTQAEATAQLNLIPVTATRQAAEQVLTNLISKGVPVSQALAVVSDAVKHNYNASQLSQVGAGIGQQAQQNVPANYAVKTADDAINANYPAARTLKALNSLRAELNHGKTPEQAYEAISTGIANNTFDDADDHRSTGMAEANISASAHLPANATMGANAGMAANAGASPNAVLGVKSFGGAGLGMHR